MTSVRGKSFFRTEVIVAFQPQFVLLRPGKQIIANPQTAQRDRGCGLPGENTVAHHPQICRKTRRPGLKEAGLWKAAHPAVRPAGEALKGDWRPRQNQAGGSSQSGNHPAGCLEQFLQIGFLLRFVGRAVIIEQIPPDVKIGMRADCQRSLTRRSPLGIPFGID